MSTFPPDPPELNKAFNLIRAVYWESYYKGYSRAWQEAEESAKMEPLSEALDVLHEHIP